MNITTRSRRRPDRPSSTKGQSYELNEDGPNKGLFNVEYTDVLGIPFDFTAKPVVAPPQPPRETVQVKAVRPERDALEIRFPRVAGYRVELPEERLTAKFTPDLVGPTVTRNAGIIGEAVDLSLEHLQDTRTSTVLFNLTQRLLYTKWRDAGEAPKLHLFGQLKRITRQWWLEAQCKGGTYPAQLMYQELADMACNKITAAITAAFADERPIKAVLDSYNPIGSTAHVRFVTSRPHRWQTDPTRCHINWVVLDSDWEAELCRVAESHTRGKAYVKNHNLGLEVPYRYGSETRRYLPDCWWTTDAAMATCCTWWSRSRATGARTPRRRRPLWTPTGCPPSTTSARSAAGLSPS